MAEEDIDQHCVDHIDRAHEKLIILIDKMLERGISVNVVDFNYDCVLERVWFRRPRFGWKCGRERKVIADEMDDTPLSALVEANRFQPPLDEKKYSTWAGLIKPHGDMCTFLRGTTEVFYRGERHSKTTTATFPPKLADISSEDRFVRSSIMPPTDSRYRHKSKFYDQERQRLIQALIDCETFIIIGWSASGTDSFYQNIFHPIFRDNTRHPRLYVIDWSPDGAPDTDLQNRLRELFGDNVTLQDIQMCGFNKATVENLEWLFFCAGRGHEDRGPDMSYQSGISGTDDG